MNVYTHDDEEEQAAAIGQLPGLESDGRQRVAEY